MKTISESNNYAHRILQHLIQPTALLNDDDSLSQRKGTPKSQANGIQCPQHLLLNREHALSERTALKLIRIRWLFE